MTKRTIDTRFFVRHFTAETEDMKKKTRKLMRELQRESAILPTIVIHELYKEQFQTLGRDTAETRINIIMQSFDVVNLDSSIAKEAARLRCKYTALPTADAIIAATALTTSLPRLVTDDRHFQEMKEIRTEWI